MYNHKVVEEKWKDYWDQNQTFKTDIKDFSKPKYYCLDMFPYPSGVGLHAGHPEGYTATDIISRMKRMQGYNVLHPMGFDAFGLPAEQYAITTGNHPSIFTMKNIETFKNQLRNIGLSYDWSKEVSTCDPKFYKWTQWIFKKMYEDGLATKVDMPVNWCEELGTVLANDEVIDGKSERGGYPVVRKNMKQWVIKITNYADKLLEGLETIDWPNSTKEIQRNWIGKSIGAEVVFKVKDFAKTFTVFTTRCDTLFGATYVVLAPEHDLVKEITTEEQREKVEKYLEEVKSKSEIERTGTNDFKTGVFTGSYAINPVNNKEIPIWISDYVLMSYGTGAIMAVPAHDDRDFAFAKTFDLPIIKVIESDVSNSSYTKDGIHINSGFLDGLNKQDAIDKMIKWLEENHCGCKKINYRLRDWIFARQRYWGEPIPIVTLEDGNTIALKDSDLPLVLPELDDYVSKGGVSPLEKKEDFVNVTIDGKKGKMETSTMPGSAGSSWYYLRYIDPLNNEEFASYDLLKHWMPVDLYIGGPEHATGHLLYSRMWNRYLYEKNLSPVPEPFKKLVHQGMILGANGIKMGKRYPKYVVDPNDIVRDYGADTLRLYEMFMGPLEADKPWNEQNVRASKKFLDKIYNLFIESDKVKEVENKNLEKIYNITVKKVTEDYENLKFNTAISSLMIFINACKDEIIPLDYALGFIKLLYPIAPFITEEMYHILTNKDTITYEPWPTYDESKITFDNVTIAISVNGKVRGTIEVKKDLSEEEVKALALSNSNVKKHLDNLNIIKIIVIKNKIVNIVAK